MTPKARRYGASVLWSDEDESFVATVPEFPHLSALGLTPMAALEELGVALELLVESLEAHGRPLPEPYKLSPKSGQLRVRLPRSLHEWATHTARREGISINQLIVVCLAEARGGNRVRHAYGEALSALATLLESSEALYRLTGVSATDVRPSGPLFGVNAALPDSIVMLRS